MHELMEEIVPEYWGKTWELGRSLCLVWLRRVGKIEPWFVTYPIRNIARLTEAVNEVQLLLPRAQRVPEVMAVTREIARNKPVVLDTLSELGRILVDHCTQRLPKYSAAHAHCLHLDVFLRRVVGDELSYSERMRELAANAEECPSDLRPVYLGRHRYEQGCAMRYSRGAPELPSTVMQCFRDALRHASSLKGERYGMDHVVFGARRNLFLIQVEQRFTTDALLTWDCLTQEFPEFGQYQLPLDAELLRCLRDRSDERQLQAVKSTVIELLRECREIESYPKPIMEQINATILGLTHRDRIERERASGSEFRSVNSLCLDRGFGSSVVYVPPRRVEAPPLRCSEVTAAKQRQEALALACSRRRAPGRRAARAVVLPLRAADAS